MALTRTINFKTIGVADNDNASNVTLFPIHVSESAQLTIEPIADIVDDGQTLPAKFNLSFEALSYNTNIHTDARVYTNGAADPVQCTLVLIGSPGAQNVNVTDSIVSSTLVMDGNRTAYRLTCTKMAVSDETLVNLS